MHRAKFVSTSILILAFALLGGAVYAQDNKQLMEDEGWIKLFKPCFGPLGPNSFLPVATDVNWERLEGRRILLATNEIVSDGFEHWLKIDNKSGTAYVLEIGGLTGSSKVFGPFPMPEGCNTFSGHVK